MNQRNLALTAALSILLSAPFALAIYDDYKHRGDRLDASAWLSDDYDYDDDYDDYKSDYDDYDYDDYDDYNSDYDDYEGDYDESDYDDYDDDSDYDDPSTRVDTASLATIIGSGAATLASPLDKLAFGKSRSDLMVSSRELARLISDGETAAGTPLYLGFLSGDDQHLHSIELELSSETPLSELITARWGAPTHAINNDNAVVWLNTKLSRRAVLSTEYGTSTLIISEFITVDQLLEPLKLLGASAAQVKQAYPQRASIEYDYADVYLPPLATSRDDDTSVSFDFSDGRVSAVHLEFNTSLEIAVLDAIEARLVKRFGAARKDPDSYSDDRKVFGARKKVSLERDPSYSVIDAVR